jgi:hypothetical protein
MNLEIDDSSNQEVVNIIGEPSFEDEMLNSGNNITVVNNTRILQIPIMITFTKIVDFSNREDEKNKNDTSCVH